MVKTESSSINGGYKCINLLMLLDPKPTAVFVADNLMTLGAMDAFNQLNLKYPEDVAFVGVADLSWSAVVKPTLTVVSPPAKQIGITSVDVLIKIISGASTIRNTREYLPAQFVIRESSTLKKEFIPLKNTI